MGSRGVNSAEVCGRRPEGGRVVAESREMGVGTA